MVWERIFGSFLGVIQLRANKTFSLPFEKLYPNSARKCFRWEILMMDRNTNQTWRLTNPDFVIGLIQKNKTNKQKNSSLCKVSIQFETLARQSKAAAVSQLPAAIRPPPFDHTAAAAATVVQCVGGEPAKWERVTAGQIGLNKSTFLSVE